MDGRKLPTGFRTIEADGGDLYGRRSYSSSSKGITAISRKIGAEKTLDEMSDADSLRHRLSGLRRRRPHENHLI